MQQSSVAQLHIGGILYDGQRVTWEAGTRGYIELRQPGGTQPVARINYNGRGAPLELCTYGAPLPMPAVEWLVDRAEWGLVEPEGFDTPSPSAA